MEETLHFTSDPHFGHDAIRTHCKRPFASVDEMDEAMIANWNARVPLKGRVICVGDFTMHKPPHPYLCRLNGILEFQLGNHDRRRDWFGMTQYTKGGAVIIHEPIREIRVGEAHIILSHYPFKGWNQSHRGSYMLYGHYHGNLRHEDDDHTTDIGMDCWNFCPVTFDEIKAHLKTLPPHKDGFTHGRT